MKKTIISTAFITLALTLVMAIAAFGVASFCFPSTMMDFTSSLGMDNLSGDYAYHEFERSGNMDCLVRSFIVAAESENDRIADDRFAILYGEENSKERARFDEYCNGYSLDTSSSGKVQVTMRSYVMGLASCVKYRLAKTLDLKMKEAYKLAIDETDESFPQGNPVVYLATEAIERKDAEFCREMRSALSNKNFDKNEDFNNIIKLLESEGVNS